MARSARMFGLLRPGSALAAVATTMLLLAAGTSAPASLGRAAERDALAAYGQLDLAFVPNAGQTDARVRFQAQAGATSFYFTRTGAVFAFAGERKGYVLRLAFVGANPVAEMVGRRPGMGKVNYLLGDDPRQWYRGLSTYDEIVYRGLWPGIDLVFRGVGGKLKYEFRLAPGADAGDIRLAYRGAERLSVGGAGDLRIVTPLGVLDDSPPLSYQSVGGRRVAIESHYALRGSDYGFSLGRHDPSRPLIIDPSLAYSTFLGGGGYEEGGGIAVDGAGNAYVAGGTEGGFPTTVGAFDTSFNGGSFDAFVTKLGPSGSGLVYSTYLGGSGNDSGIGIALDAEGNAHITGDSDSPDFPTTAGAFDRTFNGVRDAFVSKLDPSGSALVYSTYLGGSAFDRGLVIAVDGAGDAYVAGDTSSADLPITPSAFDPSFNGGFSDAFVTKLGASGSALLYSTYLGGGSEEQGRGIAVDGTGNAYLSGITSSTDFPTTAGSFDPNFNGVSDAFVTKVDSGGSALVYSTFLGEKGFDGGGGIAVDGGGNAYVTGVTGSVNFPTTAGAFDTSFNGVYDVFTTKLGASGGALVYSTYLGGSDQEAGSGIAVDGAGNAYLTGFTVSPDFPTTADAFDRSFNGGPFDAFVTKVSSSGGALFYSTYLGGSNEEEGDRIAIDSAGSAYVTGRTVSADFPTTPSAFDPTFNGNFDAFVTKLDLISAAHGTITIIEDAIPDDPQDFLFTGTDPIGSFALDDDGDPMLPKSRTFSDLAPGNYSVSEAVPAGWRLTDLGCADPDNGSTIDLGNATATIDLDPAETVTCTFTDTRQAGRCQGRVATIVGTNSGDVLTGTPGDDVIAGLGGNDVIDGQGGKDVICGDGGNDRLSGNAGSDSLSGGSGNDDLDGGNGTDFVNGGPGTDSCRNGEIVINCEFVL